MTSFAPIIQDMIAPATPARPQGRAPDTQDRFTDFLDNAGAESKASPEPDTTAQKTQRTARTDDARSMDDSARSPDEAPVEDVPAEDAVVTEGEAPAGGGIAAELMTIAGQNLAPGASGPSDPLIADAIAPTKVAGDTMATIIQALPAGAVPPPPAQAGDPAAIPALTVPPAAGAGATPAPNTAQDGGATPPAVANTATKETPTVTAAAAALATEALEAAPNLASFAKPTLEPPKIADTKPAQADSTASTPAKAATITPVGEAAPVTPAAPVKTPDTPPSQTAAAATEQKSDDAGQAKTDQAKPDAAKPETARLDPTRPDAARPDATRQPDPIIIRPQHVATPQTAATQAPVALPHLAVTVAARARGGERQFDIRLDPAELGRIDVRLSIDDQGTATTRIAVERADTLDLLQRDARSLERALSQAGFKTEDGSVQFSLRNGNDDAPRQQGSSFNEQGGQTKRYLVVDPELGGDTSTPPPAIGAAQYGRGFARLGGVDVRV